MKHTCPVCKRIVKVATGEQPEEAEFFPFCSRRCMLIDLGAWLDSKYKIISTLQAQQSGEPSNTSSDAGTDKQ